MRRRAQRSFATLALVSALLTVTLSLAGCGQKGPLYLPNPQNKKVPAAQSPTSGHPAQQQGAAPASAARAPS